MTVGAGYRKLLADLFMWFHMDIPDPLPVLMAVAGLAGMALHRRVSRDSVPLVVACLAFIAPTLLLYEDPPFWRAFVFLVPVYLALVSAGAVAAARLLGARGGSRIVAPVLAVLVTVAGSLQVSRAGTPRELIASGGMTHPERTFELLESRLRPADDVMGIRRLWWPTRYYLTQRSMADHLAWRRPDGPRAYVLIQDQAEDIAEWSDKLLEGYSGRLLTIVGNTAIYEFDKTPTVPPD